MRPDQQINKRHLTAKWENLYFTGARTLQVPLLMGSVPVGIKNALVYKGKPCEVQEYGNIIVSSSDVVSSVAVGNYFSPE